MSENRPTESLVSCSEHGNSSWCYVDTNGSHVDFEQCLCLWEPYRECPVEAHARAAEEKWG